MKERPYIYAGDLSDAELLAWLDERVHALRQLLDRRHNQSTLSEHLASLASMDEKLSTTALEGIVQQTLGSIPHLADHKNQSETISQLSYSETYAHRQAGFQVLIHPESQAGNHSATNPE